MTPKISILIAARNEAANIRRCMEAVERLNYPKDQWQVLIGDDNSQDDTAEIVNDYIKDKPHFQLVSVVGSLNNQRGKANVLAHLAQVAKGDFLFFTDADIEVPQDWISELLKHFENRVGIISGCTTIAGHSLFNHFQAIEWLWAQSILARFAAWQMPVTAVGNNMAVTREAYLATGGYENLPFSITEDWLLFHEVLKKGYTFKNLFEPPILAVSQPIEGFVKLLNQRKRWLHGAFQLPWFYKGLFLIQALFLPLLLMIGWLNPCLSVAILIAKLCSEFVWISATLIKIQQRFLVKYLSLFGFYYLFLNFAILIYYFLPFATDWKGRKY